MKIIDFRKLTLLFFVALLILICMPVWADEGHGHNHHGDNGDVNTDTVVTVDAGSDISNSISQRDSSTAIGLGGIDVDINDYYRSFGNAIWQDTKVNKLALSVFQNSVGLHEAAARSRCSVKAVREDYNSFEHCVKLNTVILPEPPGEPVSEEHLEDEEEYHEEQMQLQIDLAERIALLEEERRKPAPKPKVIERTVIEQKPLLTKELAEELRVKK